MSNLRGFILEINISRPPDEWRVRAIEREEADGVDRATALVLVRDTCQIDVVLGGPDGQPVNAPGPHYQDLDVLEIEPEDSTALEGAAERIADDFLAGRADVSPKFGWFDATDQLGRALGQPVAAAELEALPRKYVVRGDPAQVLVPSRFGP